MRGIVRQGRWVLAGIALAVTGAAADAQSSAGTYSYGTYNPVQAAINRNSMNAAILRQATHGRHGATTRRSYRTTRHRRR